MMKYHGYSMPKRLLAAFLGLVLALGMLPCVPFAVGAVGETDAGISAHVYDWGKLDTAAGDGSFVGTSEGFTVTAEDLLGFLTDGGEDIDSMEGASVSAVASEGATATVNADGSVSFVTDHAGTQELAITVNKDGRVYTTVYFDVYVYGISDDVFVLDYGLIAYMNDNGEMLANDIVELEGNPAETFYTLSVSEQGGQEDDDYFMGQYGDFMVYDSYADYHPADFLAGPDTVLVAVTISETEGAEASDVDQYTGVTMVQALTVAPANVVYYEDNFGSIVYYDTYNEEGDGTGVGNVWAQYVADEFWPIQDVDQDTPYGSDPTYAYTGSDVLFFDTNYVGDDEEISARVQAELDVILNGSVADWEEFMPDIPYPAGELLGDASGNRIHVLNVNHAPSVDILSFDFTGTGFDIVSRTSVYAYGVLTVVVEQEQEDGSYKVYKAIPVITESTGGDLTQVPLVSRKDLPYGNYRVTVRTSNVNDIDRVVYVDGIRIYGALNAEDSARYYRADEANATFNDIKQEIKDGKIVYGTISPSVEADDVVDYITRWAYGTTMIEDADSGFVLTGTDPFGDMTEYEQYMAYGPNNEIYLSTANGAKLSYIAFYVIEDEDYVGERSIQVGAHLKYTGDNLGVGDEFTDFSGVTMLYGGNDFDIIYADDSRLFGVTSGTEQYFSLDTSCLQFTNPNGVRKALVIIGTDDPNQNTLVLTNLKLNGYSIAEGTGAEVAAVRDADDVRASKLTEQTYSLYRHYVLDPKMKEGAKS